MPTHQYYLRFSHWSYPFHQPLHHFWVQRLELSQQQMDLEAWGLKLIYPLLQYLNGLWMYVLLHHFWVFSVVSHLRNHLQH